MFGVTSGRSGYCNIHIQSRHNEPDLYLFIYLLVFFKLSMSLGTHCMIFTVVASCTCGNRLTQSCFKCVFCLVAMDYLSHWFDIKACAGFVCVLCCKTNDSDQLFMSVNTLEILLVFIHFGCAAGIQRRRRLLRRTASQEPP